MPKRIQRKRAKGWRMPANAVVVSRPTQWGNDFKVGIDGTAAECVEKYRLYFIGPTLEVHGMAYFEPLRGKDLACWCGLVDKQGNRIPCHADVLLELCAELEKKGEGNVSL